MSCPYKSAAPLAFSIPAWVMEQNGDLMQIDSGILDCAVFVGFPTDHGFFAEGTAFFIRHEIDGIVFLYLVSCRHVVRPTISRRDLTPNDEPIWIRFNRKLGDTDTIKTKRSDWIRHQTRDVDVCVLPFDYNTHNSLGLLKFTSVVADGGILTEELNERWHLGLGDEVFAVGAFVGRIGEKQNIPVIRVGNIASMPSEPMWGASHNKPAFLIETRSLGGISGSPLFLHTAPHREIGPPRTITGQTPDGGTSLATPYFLIGMMQGFHSGSYKDDFLWGEDDATDEVIPKDAEFNAGIGVAIPIGQIMELLDRPDLSEARMKSVDARRRTSDHQDASAKHRAISSNTEESCPLATDENPNHRGDFMRLVGEAARKREPED